MKTVIATWEKRSIGVDCNEITIEADDTVETINKEMSKHEAEYTVVKVPAGQTEVLFYLQKLGFIFIETLTICYHKGEPFNLNRIQQRIIKQVSYEEMNDDDIDFMFKEMKAGLFQTDRIALDPYFTIEQSNNRYVYWIRDELDSGAKAYKLVYDDKGVGFFTIKKQTDDELFAFLAGIYSDFLNTGLGFCTNYYEVEEGKRQGAKRIMTAFSSNNRGAAAIHFSMGCVLHKLYYVLIKHKAELL